MNRRGGTANEELGHVGGERESVCCFGKGLPDISAAGAPRVLLSGCKLGSDQQQQLLRQAQQVKTGAVPSGGAHVSC